MTTKLYRASLDQSGTAAPTADIIGLNTVGTVVWTRSSTGVYLGTLALAFPEDNTTLYEPSFTVDPAGAFDASLEWVSVNAIRLRVFDISGNAVDVFTDMVVQVSVSVETAEIIDLTTVKRYLKIGTTDQDTLLTQLITVASNAIERITGGYIVPTEVIRIYNGNGSSIMLLDDKPALDMIEEAETSQIYAANLTQTGTAAPVPTVIGTNGVGTIVWTRSSAGTYVGTLTGAFVGAICYRPNLVPHSAGAFVASLSRTNNDTVSLKVYDPGGNLVDVWTDMSILILTRVSVASVRIAPTVKDRTSPTDAWVTLEDEPDNILLNSWSVELYDNTFTSGRSNIQITHYAGYDPIPEVIEQVCLEMVAEMFADSSVGDGRIGMSSRSVTSQGGAGTDSFRSLNDKHIEMLQPFMWRV